MMHNAEILMIFPRLGSEDVFVKDIPLGLLYASTNAIKKGFLLRLLDLRLYDNWERALRTSITPDLKIVGISVYTGNPIRNALEVSRVIKRMSTAVVVWGGPHPSLDPSITLQSPFVDYLVRGYGSEAFGRLADYIISARGSVDDIGGLSWKNNGIAIHNPISPRFESLNYRDIPYHLIEHSLSVYSRFNSKERLIPIYTSMGCPHKCAFCVAPVLYKEKRPKWIAFPDEHILGHIQYLKTKYHVDHISVYDDDVFLDAVRMKRLLRAIKANALGIRFSFRGARIDELDRMDDETLRLLEDTGATHFSVGIESGSDRILELMNKNITVKQIIRVNKRLGRFNKLVPIYNIMAGMPGEGIDDLKKTADIMIRLLQDNPHCVIGIPNKYNPYPGADLFDRAVESGMKRPENIEEWIKYDSVANDNYFSWYTTECNHFIKMMQFTAYFADRKLEREVAGKYLFGCFIRSFSHIYYPIAYWRLKHKCDKLLIEGSLLRVFESALRKSCQRHQGHARPSGN